jgi:hypothetical protein
MHLHTFARCLAAAVLAGAAPAQTLTATPVDILMGPGSVAYDAGRRQPVMLRRYISATACDLVTWNGADWVPILPQITVPFGNGSLVHDALRDRLVAFDGGNSIRFIGGQTVSAGPTIPGTGLTVISGRQLVHDVARDELVAFGGWDRIAVPPSSAAYHDETFRLRQGTWQQVLVATRPAKRAEHALVYDPVRQRTVLFGGHGGTWNSTTQLGDTWEWDGTSWAAIAASGPAAGDARGTFDPNAQRVVVRDATGAVWSFDGAAWTPVGASTTPRFSNSTLVSDGGALLLVGGWTTSAPVRTLIETWRLESGAWRRIPTAVHEPGDYSALMAYDSVRRELLCLSGQAMVNWIPTTTWTWNGTWQEHPGPAPAWGRMAFDAARGQVVLFGGLNGGPTGAETWTWNGTSWTQRAPAQSPPAEPLAYRYSLLAYDPLRRVVVLVGSAGSWLWDGSNWSQAPGPQPPAGALLVWDPVRSAVVLSATPSGATWEWSGQWQQVAATGGPPYGDTMMAAFDPSRGRTFAYVIGSGYVGGDEWEWTGTTWTSRPAPVPMQLQYARDMATDTDRGRVLFRGVIAPAQGLQLHVLGPTPSRVDDAGGGCQESLVLTADQRPAIGATIELASAMSPPGPALLLFAAAPNSYQIGTCTVVADGSLTAIGLNATAASRVELPLTIPPSAALRGGTVWVQAVAVAGGALRFSRAVRLAIGD